MELTRTRTRDLMISGLPLFGGDDPEPTIGVGLTIQSGPFSQHLTVPAGTTVGEVRRRFGVSLHIAAGSVAQLAGDMADDETVVRAGEILTFYPRAGEKGQG
ncbi:MAG: hypothetical protein KJ726_09155 [Verrucomicrobia bacterium]|nr:hypothetical protein [Verrucomicrobiota bacterium]MBU1910204.1 hypothetical protein [Verrucomicrobiota bacterium]